MSAGRRVGKLGQLIYLIRYADAVTENAENEKRAQTVASRTWAWLQTSENRPGKLILDQSTDISACYGHIESAALPAASRVGYELDERGT